MVTERERRGKRDGAQKGSEAQQLGHGERGRSRRTGPAPVSGILLYISPRVRREKWKYKGMAGYCRGMVGVRPRKMARDEAEFEELSGM